MYSILVVDDDKMNLILAKKLLQKEYEVFSAESGQQTLDFLNEKTPDLILLDIQMPDMTGFDVLSKIPKSKKIPVIFLTADRSETTEEQCFEAGAADFISKPFIPAIMLQRVRRCIELQDYRKNLEKVVSYQLDKITQYEQNTIIMLANIIESRDGTTGEHVKRSKTYVEYLINQLQKLSIYSDELTPMISRLIIRAAPMHDIGKITIDDSILKKRGGLSTEEYEQMKLHTVAGGNIIKKNMTGLVEKEFVEIAFDVATYHHEKWDGTGYPKGLKGTEIPLCARIMAIADVFDALTSNRSYKEKFDTEKAIETMTNEMSSFFDPLLLNAFTSNKEELIQLKEKS